MRNSVLVLTWSKKVATHACWNMYLQLGVSRCVDVRSREHVSWKPKICHRIRKIWPPSPFFWARWIQFYIPLYSPNIHFYSICQCTPKSSERFTFSKKNQHALYSVLCVQQASFISFLILWYNSCLLKRVNDEAPRDAFSVAHCCFLAVRTKYWTQHRVLEHLSFVFPVI